MKKKDIPTILFRGVVIAALIFIIIVLSTELSRCEMTYNVARSGLALAVVRKKRDGLFSGDGVPDDEPEPKPHISGAFIALAAALAIFVTAVIFIVIILFF